MANVSKEMLLVLMVAAVAVVGLVLLIQNNVQINLTGQAFSVGSDSKMKSTATLPTLTKPDFYVKGIQNLILVYDPTDGSRIAFDLEIGNKGKATGTVNQFTFDVYAYNAETVSDWDTMQTFSHTGTIAAGSSVVISKEIEVSNEWVEEVMNGHTQDIDIQIYVDWKDNTAESDETNNAWASTNTMSESIVINLAD